MLRRQLILVAALPVFLSGRRPGSAAFDAPIHVGGTYATTVTLLENSCGAVTIEQHETVITHGAGDTTLSVTHAGNSYAGKLKRDATFVTTTKTIVDPGGNIGIAIAGKFTKTAIDATVTVTIARVTPCQYKVRWQGPKKGPPNELP